MEEYRPNKLLCVVAHTDDVEVTLGGTVAKWTSAGTEVCYLICSDGSRGAKDSDHAGTELSRTRAREQHAAGQVLGVDCLHQLSHCDGELEANDELRAEIVRAIRSHKPDAVFTMDPTFYYSTRWGYANHRDHRAVGQAVFDAVYPMSRDATSLPELIEEGFEPHAVSQLLMCHYERENYFINITDSYHKKEEAIRKHVSQFGDSNGILEHLYHRAVADGENIGVERAEGFIRLDVSMGS